MLLQDCISMRSSTRCVAWDESVWDENQVRWNRIRLSDRCHITNSRLGQTVWHQNHIRGNGITLLSDKFSRLRLPLPMPQITRLRNYKKQKPNENQRKWAIAFGCLKTKCLREFYFSFTLWVSLFSWCLGVTVVSNMDVFLEKVQTALTLPPPLSLFGNYIAIFENIRKYA